jgi:hypothetical protein
VEVILEAARNFSLDPAGAIGALERYLAGEPLEELRQ